MTRRLLILAAFLLALAAPAQAHPVSVHRAQRAISHWWRDRQPPHIEWCARKRYGTVCALFIPAHEFDCTPSCTGITGSDTKIVWVSWSHGQVRVAALGDYLTLRIAP